jgi:hypothetical protein
MSCRLIFPAVIISEYGFGLHRMGPLFNTDDRFYYYILIKNLPLWEMPKFHISISSAKLSILAL